MRITVEPHRENSWVLIGIGMLVGIVGIGVGLLLLARPDHIDYLSQNAFKIIICGILCLALFPALLLIRLVNGPARKVTLEAHPGRLKADRFISGMSTASLGLLLRSGCGSRRRFVRVNPACTA